MNILLKATNLDLTPSIKAFVESKLGALEKLLVRFDALSGLELRVEIGRTTRHHRHGDVFRAEINLQLPGRLLRAVDEAHDIRVAIDRAREVMKLEIQKYKTQRDPKVREKKKS